MTQADGTATASSGPDQKGAVSFLSAVAALDVISDALRGAQAAEGGSPSPPAVRPEQALASLLLLRQVREQLAGWESGLIETARDAGASWGELAAPLGVASRQAAERRYLRVRPGAAGTTGEQRVQATRASRAADRTVTAWARDNAADLRRLAGQITALTDLPSSARNLMGALDRALAADDAARLVGPLVATRPLLEAAHPDLAARIDSLTRHTDHLRQGGGGQGRTT
ncbi:type III effector protein [Streptomyces sp. APSN-46.1]|uniref:type III effector protein n=1 Tax=Streptomyces sp. APSN-46.1 TaxID=2929049 RepID=UPI001FB2DCA3|nr:type III effector protein [Streptomyces sp. APSN-46.1]MCJ1676437.1 type III effector protein [Streptomyces sp. APSN-46.1]